MSATYKINGHGHLLPYPEQIPTFMKKRKLFWLDADRKFMRQDNWSRPITDPSFFLEEKLEWMERNKIDHEVILNLSQLYCNGFDQSTARDVIRFQNDFNAETQANHPEKITAGFVVQAAFVQDALTEIDRCVNELGLQLLCLPTHYLDLDGQWTSVVNESTKPIFECANELGLALEIHPYDGPKMIKLKDELWRFHLIWMCAQTADTFHSYTSYGFETLYPKLRACFAHGNQYGQINYGRRKQGFEGRPDLFQKAAHPSDSLGATNLYFDTLVHDVLSFKLLVERQSAQQIIAGLDDPYPLGEMESVPGCYPGKVIDEALEASVISKSEYQAIWKNNVVRWLCGEKSSEFLNRIQPNQ